MENARSIEHAEIVHRCFRCGYCKFPGNYADFNCPPYKAFGWDTYAPGGRMWLIRAWLNGEIQATPRFAEILYSCVACDNCKDQCVFPKFKDFLPDIFQETKAELVAEGKIPPKVRDYFKAIDVNGNPYKLPQAERGKWAEGTGLREFSDQEYLFYVGCVGSYDEVGQKMARAVGSLLSDVGVSLGILGREETCDGNEVKILGETGLFTKLAEDNIQKLKKKGVKKIITLDPHALNAFKKDYPKLGGNFKVSHYTEILAGLIKEKRIALSEYRAKVTYHDPCYLGRQNLIYAAPREILNSIPGLELVEMRRNRENAFCCGGGGGNFFTDILGGGENSAGRVRLREALETRARIIAVACPNCAKMLIDAVKTEEKEDKIEVLGIAEIVGRARPK
jgi:Fe-S oxidoreductase